MSQPRTERTLTAEETVHVKFVLSGERERLKKLAKEKLERSGWTDELRQSCRDAAARCGPDALAHSALVSEVGPQSKSHVPDYLKAEILSEIKAILES